MSTEINIVIKVEDLDDEMRVELANNFIGLAMKHGLDIHVTVNKDK